ncbi:hypothetical protein [Flavobacterium cerinum]|uniref:DUF541 domain-containing protein n=1 Tax=Flavobacterium cerinum TaxID=2502784 RepID=A0A3S3U2N7_9FLAO|nr:hypothetical protein [Flavobacterium cerinum]RWX00224.1 hypothetical protein EPI11_10095 [Flavobacterium cerinum]
MKNLALIALLFVSFGSYAQTKFIEVEVTDTISLKPLNFRCNVYAQDNTDVYSYDVAEDEEYDPLAAAEKAKNKLNEVKGMLETKKYKVLPLDESKINLLERRPPSKEGFSIVVNDEAEMKKLKELLNSREDVTTVVVVLKYSDKLKAEEKLIKKLIDKAKARAAFIGVTSGLKTGKILEVKEGRKSNEASFTELYSQLLKMGSFGQENNDYTGSISKTFVVKFAAE